jgi:predicted DNA-binding protein
MAERNLRLPDELAKRIADAAHHRGFASSAAFIREAIEHELVQTDATASRNDAEERVAATIEHLAKEVRRVHTAVQALFAFSDALAKALFTCLPEPSGEVYAQASARAQYRYERFLRSVGIGIDGDSRAALAELIHRIE